MIKSEQIVKTALFLEKFRRLIIIMLIILIAAASLVYCISDYIISYITIPLNGTQLCFMTPAEGFMAKLKIAFLGGVVLAAPIAGYIIIYIARPTMNKKTKRLLRYLIIPLGFILLVGGIFFGYKMIMPSTIKFLLECGNEFMTPTLSGDEYFSFVGTLLLAVGFIFELPLVLIGLSRVGIVTSVFLKGKRKVAVMVALITIALISPALDAFTFILVTAPIILLYEISIWSIFILERRDKRLKLKRGA